MQFDEEESAPPIVVAYRTTLPIGRVEVTEPVLRIKFGDIPPDGYMPGEHLLMRAIVKALTGEHFDDDPRHAFERMTVAPDVRAEAEALVLKARSHFMGMRNATQRPVGDDDFGVIDTCRFVAIGERD